MKFASLALFATMLAGCASEPLLGEGEPGRIVAVEVTRADPSLGSRNLAEDVRVKTLNAAYRFAGTGPEKTLKVEIVGFRLPSESHALLLDASVGQSAIAAEATLTDAATGAAARPFQVQATHAGVGGLVGMIAARSFDPIEDERALASELAQAIMVRIYGEARAEEAAGREPSQKAVAQYPASYEEEADRIACQRMRARGDDLPSGCARF